MSDTARKKPDYGRRSTTDGYFPSLRQIRTFAMVARFESISRASAELTLSQSAVTQAVATLETELEAQLFARWNRGTYLTTIGRILKRRTDRFFDSVEEALVDFAETTKSRGSAAPSVLARRITRAQILALIAIKASGSFMQAARHAGVSQTSIHRSARSLEGHLGATIFRNAAHGVTINAHGSRLADQLLLATREFEWAFEEIEAEKGVVRGRILVGGLMLAGSYFLSSVLSKFIAACPDAYVQMANGPYDVLLDRLRTGSLDFVVGLLKNPPPAEDVVEEVLVADPYVIAARKDHPLARRSRVTREELAAFEWVLPAVTAARRVTYENIFAGTTPPHTNIETHSFTTILTLLADSDRMTILTESELLLDKRLGHHLVALNYSPIEPNSYIGLTVRKGWLPTRLQSIFLEYLKAGHQQKHLLLDQTHQS